MLAKLWASMNELMSLRTNKQPAKPLNDIALIQSSHTTNENYPKPRSWFPISRKFRHWSSIRRGKPSSWGRDKFNCGWRHIFFALPKERCGDPWHPWHPWIPKVETAQVLYLIISNISISFHTFPAFGRESRVICKPSCRMMSETQSPSDRSQKARRTSFPPFQIWCRWGHTACRCQTSAFCILDFERTTYSWSYPHPARTNQLTMYCKY